MIGWTVEKNSCLGDAGEGEQVALGEGQGVRDQPSAALVTTPSRTWGAPGRSGR